SLVRGALWGLAGFAAFSLVPAVGVPPALPGGPESPLAPRQLWWIVAVLCTAGGLALLAFASGRWWRWAGLPLLALPFLFPAPHAQEALGTELVSLTQRFIATTLAVNLASWLVLGAVSGWLWARQTARAA
ncbi:MAG TPA: CbtA family protein, partial [bacterium]